MQNIYRLPNIPKRLFIAVIAIFSIQFCKAQSVILPYSYQLDQKFDASIYSVNNSFHTALKPFLIDSIISGKYNQVMSRGVDSSHKTWVGRKLFNEHLFDVKEKDFTFYGDYLPDLQGGRDFSHNLNTDLNTRGYQFGGTVGDKFFFYTSGFENSGVFPTYYNDIIKRNNLIPGQAYDRNFGQFPSKDWSYVTAEMSYTPIKQLNFVLGYDKTFIGDGYRSLLLSDFSPNTPLFRVTANLGKVQYMMMWSYMEDQSAKIFDSFGNYRRKWGGFHYLDWNITNRLSVGYFNAFIAEEANDNGNLHGFDANFFDPVIFAGGLNSNTTQPDNILTGFTAKYKVFDKSAIYAQLLLDRGIPFSGGNNSNTGGYQVGIRGADLFGVTDFNYLFELNSIRPDTYTASAPIVNYANFDESLGDPFGGNVRELIGILNYSIGRFDFMGELMYAKYGADPTGIDNVMEPFVASSTPTFIGQGVLNNEYYAEGTASFLINPKTNLRFELGGVVRDDKTPAGSGKTIWLTFGLRSTFRQIYHDL